MKINRELICTIALGMVPSVGDINARRLIEHLGSAEAVFNQPYNKLVTIPGIGRKIAGNLSSKKYISRAEEELEYVQKHNISVIRFNEEPYPERLKNCPDSPLVLFSKGDANLNARKIISIVGTRNITRRGKDICRSIIRELSEEYPSIVIVSGLAYGVDIAAHKSALEHDLPTIAILGHGFKTIYPPAHLGIARKILDKGALVTDFPSYEKPERNNFLKRNRIIAGISDACIIIESGRKGGAMVTADIAMSYNRDVMAVPGYPGMPYSEGCNMLIKSNKAALVESADDIIYNLGWVKNSINTSTQNLFTDDLSPIEKRIFKLFEDTDELSSEQLSASLKKPVHHLASALLKLEFSGHIESIPGNRYRRRH